jgi:hypothetical protein
MKSAHASDESKPGSNVNLVWRDPERVITTCPNNEKAAVVTAALDGQGTARAQTRLGGGKARKMFAFTMAKEIARGGCPQQWDVGSSLIGMEPAVYSRSVICHASGMRSSSVGFFSDLTRSIGFSTIAS